MSEEEKKETESSSEDSSEDEEKKSSSSESDSSDDDQVDHNINDVLAGLDDTDDEDDMPKTKSTRKTKLKQILREFSDLSSTHAIGHIGEAHSRNVIIFWVVILLICAGLFGWLFQTTLRKFMSYPVNVEVTMVNEARNFPAITVCNQNPFKKSELLKVDETAGLVLVFDAIA